MHKRNSEPLLKSVQYSTHDSTIMPLRPKNVLPDKIINDHFGDQALLFFEATIFLRFQRRILVEFTTIWESSMGVFSSGNLVITRSLEGFEDSSASSAGWKSDDACHYPVIPINVF